LFHSSPNPFRWFRGSAGRQLASILAGLLTFTSSGIPLMAAEMAPRAAVSQPRAAVTIVPTHVTLSTADAIRPTGAEFTLRASVAGDASAPVEGAAVHFTITSGANSGTSRDAVTDPSGIASATLTSDVAGASTVVATTTGADPDSPVTSSAVRIEWVAPQSCPSAAGTGAGAATQLVYFGATSGEVTEPIVVGAHLTDGSGAPIASQAIAFTLGGSTSVASTDANGVARTTMTPAVAGNAVASADFSGGPGYAASHVQQNVSIGVDESEVRYAGSLAIAAGTPQTVSAYLFDGVDHSPLPLSGRPLVFEIAGQSVSATTAADGKATATITINPASGGPLPLKISFAGDALFAPSSQQVQLTAYTASSFVIWGGNNGGLSTGQRVNFWGHSWSDQVTGGAYDTNAGFKGFSGRILDSLCQPNANPSSLTQACWSVKDGESFPPAALPLYIGVAVSTAINKINSNVYGNVAAVAVVKVDPAPAYGPDPGKPGFGTIVSIAADSNVFPQPSVAAVQSQPANVFPGEPFNVLLKLTNNGGAPAQNLTASATFTNATTPSATASLTALAPASASTLTFAQSTAVPAVRQSGETTSNYEARLASLDGQMTSSSINTTYTDATGLPYPPVLSSSASVMQLPRLSAAITGPLCVTPAQKVTSTVVVTNVGSAAAASATVIVTFPDSTSTTIPVETIPPGRSRSVFANWTVPAVAARADGETEEAYSARLSSIDGTQIITSASVAWTDVRSNQYGDVAARYAAIERLPILAPATTATGPVAPNSVVTITSAVQNKGRGDAIETHVAVTNPDSSTSTVDPFTVASGATRPAVTTFTTAAVEPKAQSESDVAYRARLAALDNSDLTFRSAVTWTDAEANRYGTLTSTASTRVTLPVLRLDLTGQAAAMSGETLAYHATISNEGHAAATGAELIATLPDGTTQSIVVPASAGAVGGSSDVPFSYAVPRSQPDGVATVTLSLRWNDAAGNLYGALSSTATTVVTRPNDPPAVNAGPDVTITMPETATLAGTVTDDGKPLGASLQISWSAVSGPGTVTFANAASPATIVSFSTHGTYVLRLTANDSELTASDDVVVTVLKANEPPLVDAGSDQSILQTETATLAGSFTDDGLPAGATPLATWSVVSGPGTVTFANSAAVATTATFSASGTYVVRLTVTDTLLTGSDDVTITVNNPNEPPAVNAGADQSVRLPNAVTLSGSVSDDGRPAGSPLVIAWTQRSGAGTATFTAPSSAITNVTFSAPGDYVLRLSANDGELAADDEVTVHVTLAQIALTPTAAGPNVTGTSQTMTATFTENGAPAGGQSVLFTITGLNARTATVMTNGSGVATFTYTGIANGSDTIVATSGAGTQLVTSNSARVDWVTPLQKVSTTAIRGRFFIAANIGNFSVTPAQAPAFEQYFPTINFNPPSGTVPGNTSGVNELTRPMYDVTTDLNGNFTGTILGKGNGYAIGAGAMNFFNAVFTGTFTVASAGNVTFNFYSDDGFIFGISGGATRVSGANFNPPPNGRTPFEDYPVMGAFNTATAPVANSVTVNFPAPGSYPYELDYSECCVGQLAITMTTATPQGNRGVPPTGSLVITPNAFSTQPVGSTQTVTITAVDASGTPLSALPVTLTITGANGQELHGATDNAGKVVFSYTGTNAGGDALQATAPVGATVAYSNIVAIERGANQRPVVNAGADQSITLPTNRVTLSATYTDDGQPVNGVVTYTWSVVSGSGVTFVDTTDGLHPIVQFANAGTVTLRFTGSDGSLSTTDDVVVVVNPDPNANKPPVVSAGPDKSVELPNTVTLNGNVTDDGKVTATPTISWVKTAGPGTATFTPANSATPTVSFSLPGSYTLQLRAFDGQFTSTDDVIVIVSAANVAPTVNAGPDKSIGLPTNTVQLSGTVTDDGKPTNTVTISWSMVSGPAAVTFNPANAAVTTATFTKDGQYPLRLTASDGALSNFDDVVVNVFPPNKAPVANAGADQAVTRPGPAALSGTVTDDGIPSGVAVTVSWSKVSGPGTVAFSAPTSLNTNATFSASGSYTLRLTANDSQLTGFDDVVVTVNDPPPPPAVSLTSPAPGTAINAPIDITGTIAGGTWRVEYALVNDDNPAAQVWTVLASGSGARSGTLAHFDPSVLLNGTYELRIFTTDQYGQISTSTNPVSAEGQLKVGQFSVSYTDLTVPLPGLDLSITRTYDTRDKRVGDFGFGWEMGMRNVRVQKNGVLGSNWEQIATGSFIVTYTVRPTRPHYVTITFPDNKVYKFQVQISPSSQQVYPIDFASVYFTQVDTTPDVAGASLISMGADDDVFVDGGVGGPVQLLDLTNLEPYTASAFRLTTNEGYQYTIDQKLGVTSITDPNQNEITIGPNGITHSAGRSVNFLRDSAGRITRITDPNGKAILYTYNAAGDLATVTARDNGVSTFTYDNAHQLITIKDPNGIEPVHNEYDASGRLIRQTDAKGNVQTYSTNIDGRTEVVTDRLGKPTTFVYDDDGNILQKVDALGGITGYTYDSNGNMLSETNPAGIATNFTYDNVGNRLTETDAAGNKTSFTYNAFHEKLSITDPRGKTLNTTYDAQGNTTSVKDPSGATRTFAYSGSNLMSQTDAMNRTTSYSYDAFGHVTQLTDSTGRIATYTYDPNGNKLTETVPFVTESGTQNVTLSYQYDGENRLTKVTYPDGTFAARTYTPAGQLATETDPRGNTITYTYDESGRKTKTSYPDSTFESTTYDAEGRALTKTDRANHTTAFTYDAIGRLTQTTFPDGKTQSTTYDPAGHVLTVSDNGVVTEEHTYDNNGRRTSMKNALGQVTTYEYDAGGNVTAIHDPAGKITRWEYDANSRRTKTTYHDGSFETLAYNANGEVTSKTDTAGRITTYTYDDGGRVTSVKDAATQTYSYAYDANGNLLSITDPNAHVTRFEYDGFGRRTKRTLPLGMSETFAYDTASNVASHTDFNGFTTTFAYDANGRLTTKTPDARLGQPAVQFTYNPAGTRASMTDASGTTTYTYDARNRRISKTSAAGTLNYTYDAANNLASTASNHPGGVNLQYGYDAGHRLTSVADPLSGTTGYTYDTAGNLASITQPNGVITSFTYDARDRASLVRAARGGVGIASYAQTFDAASNIASVTEASGRVTAYTYDPVNHLTSETIGADPAGVNGTIAHVYDAAGNRISRSSSVAPVPSLVSTYDANDRLLSETYDANGNATITSGLPNTYDFENHLTSRGGVQVVYDGDGNRVAKTVNGVTTRYLVDDMSPTGYAQVAEEISGGVVRRSYAYGLFLIAEHVGPQTAYYGFDSLGSVRYLTSATGAVTDTYDYDAWGNLLHSTGSTPNSFLYRGQEFDSDLGIYYLRARYYDANTGRFLTVDPEEGRLKDSLTLHRYVYAASDPVNKSDPSGREFDMGSMMSAMNIMGSLIAQNWLRGMTIGFITGAGFASAEEYLSSGHVTAGNVLTGGFLGAILGPFAEAAMAIRLARIGLTVASAAIGSYAAYGAYEKKQYSLALFYVVTSLGGALFSAFGPRPRLTPPASAVASSENGAVFWAGGDAAREAAEAYAATGGGTTLGQTPAGQNIQTRFGQAEWADLREVWAEASAAFASNARGDVHIFVTPEGAANPGNILNSVELPILRARQAAGLVFDIIFHPIQ